MSSVSPMRSKPSLRSMKYYADSTNRRQWQILADVLAVIWLVLCVSAGRNVYSGIQEVRPAADSLSSAGDSIAVSMAGAANGVANAPFVGGALRGPFDAVAAAGQTLADAGTSLGRTIDQFSRSAGLFVQRSAGDGVGGSRHVGGDGVTGRGEAVGRGAYLLDSVVDVCARLRRRGRLTRVLTPRRGSATAGGWRCRRNTSST